MTETPERHLSDLARALARGQIRPGYAAIAVVGASGAPGYTPHETTLLAGPDVDLERVNVIATRAITTDIAEAYASRHHVDRGVVNVRVFVVLCGRPASVDDEYVVLVHGSKLAARYLGVPPMPAFRPFEVVQGGRA